MKYYYDTNELIKEMNSLKNTFYLVRLVDPLKRVECIITPNNSEIDFKEYNCYATWEKNQQCKNCVSAKAFFSKTSYTKFEFINNKVFYIISKYVNINGYELVLELINEVSENIMLNADGYNEFIDRISHINSEIYSDELSQVYGRQYLNEKLPIMLEYATYRGNKVGVAIVDIDDFKSINDSYGHLIGDEIIKAIASLLKGNVSERRGDFIVRFGGDEFIVVLNNISKDTLYKKVQLFVERAQQIIMEDIQYGQLTLSIGAAFSDELSLLDMRSIIALADKRLYQAKSRGKNQAVFL
ncbi:MAG: GGDEF domain-containing protein [Cellulosilyticaceae bacterium]